MFKNLPCQHMGHEFDPWSEEIPHATGQLNPCATTTEPHMLQPSLHNRSCYEKSHSTAGEEPHSAAARESPHAAMQTPVSHK